MKVMLFMLLSFSFNSFADEDCSVPQAPTLPSEFQEVAETVVDVSGQNNTCPNRPYEDYFQSASTIEELRTQVNTRLASMGLTAEWEAGRDRFSQWAAFGDTPEDLVRARRLANVTVAAMSQYPSGFFQRAGLDKIKLIKDLRVSANGQSQARMAVPLPASDMLYFAENNEPGLTACLEEIEMRMHHEFFHLMEGTFNRNEMRPNITSWNRINPENFDYQQGGDTAYGAAEAGFADRERPIDGFPTGYATFGAEEDRSEVFAYMMTRGFAERQRGWASVDPVLNRKVQYIERFLRDNLDVGPDFFQRGVSSPRVSSSP